MLVHLLAGALTMKIIIEKNAGRGKKGKNAVLRLEDEKEKCIKKEIKLKRTHARTAEVLVFSRRRHKFKWASSTTWNCNKFSKTIVSNFKASESFKIKLKTNKCFVFFAGLCKLFTRQASYFFCIYYSTRSIPMLQWLLLAHTSEDDSVLSLSSSAAAASKTHDSKSFRLFARRFSHSFIAAHLFFAHSSFFI